MFSVTRVLTDYIHIHRITIHNSFEVEGKFNASLLLESAQLVSGQSFMPVIHSAPTFRATRSQSAAGVLRRDHPSQVVFQECTIDAGE